MDKFVATAQYMKLVDDIGQPTYFEKEYEKDGVIYWRCSHGGWQYACDLDGNYQMGPVNGYKLVPLPAIQFYNEFRNLEWS